MAATAAIALGPAAGIAAQNPAAAQTAAPSQSGKGFGDYLSARMAATDHDIGEAARLYQQSLQNDPNNSEILAQAFFFTAANGDVAGAANMAQRMIQTDADNRGARLTLAVDAMARGDFAGARTQIAQSGKGPFTSLTLTLLDAWAAQGLDDTDTALNDLKQVTSEGGTEALAAYHRALLLDLAGRSTGAEAAYKEAIAAGNTGPRIVNAYGRFLEREGRSDDARAFYNKYADDAASGPIAKAGLARIQAGEKPDRLVNSAKEGAAEALFGIAASLSDATTADVAILYLRFALDLAPNLDLAKIVLADRFEALDRYNDAIAVYRTVAPTTPFGQAAKIQIAVDLMRLNQNDKAIDQLKEALAQAPNDISAWTSLGDAYRAKSDFTKAADAYNHAVSLLGTVTSKDWPLFFARGISEERSNDWTAAEADLERALKLAPQQPDVLNYLGYSWVDKGERLPEALAMLEKARSLSPFNGYIVDSVGWAYYRLGKYAEAAKVLESAVLLVPGDATINDHFGDALWRIGRKRDARFQWNHALAFGPEADEKAKIEQKLASGLPSSGH